MKWSNFCCFNHFRGQIRTVHFNVHYIKNHVKNFNQFHFLSCFFNLFLSSQNFQLSLLMRFRIPTLNDLKRTFWGIIQSTCFLTTNGYTFSLILCILRHYIGSFNFFTASFVPSFIASAIALTIERPTRRGLLCLYVSNVATETLFNMACSRGYCHSIPYGQVLIFGASISVLLYYFRSGLHQRKLPIKRGTTATTVAAGGSQQHTQKDSIYDILRFVIGRYEEYVPPLQLQPQFLSRRRERQASAPVLMAPRQQQNDPSIAHVSGAANSSQRRPPKNPFLPYILRAVRYYSQAMDYFKFGLPRHKTCPHPRDSCIHYVVSGGAKMFTLGVGLQVTLTLIKLKMASKKPMLSQLKSMFRSPNMLKLGTFLGGFAAIFRVSKQTRSSNHNSISNHLDVLQLSSCSLRHITGNDDPLNGVPAAFLASIAFASYPDTTVALYVFWKALQVNVNLENIEVENFRFLK